MFRSPARVALIAASLVVVACSQPVDDEVETSSHSIVGGEEAEAGAWPGTVALYKGGSRPSCGGALVADSWVLTAGHCVSTYSATGGISKVVIGRHRLSTEEGETRTVDAVYRHEGYRNLDNDIALLHLSQPSSAPKAKLVSAEQVAAVVEGAMTTAVGWGNTREGGSPSDVLRQVDVPVISNAQCKTYPRYSTVTDNMICAGYPNGQKDACQGDSGSPLFMEIDGEKVVVGLVSWGIGCARANAPGVYTRVGNYLGWLAAKSNNEIGGATTPAGGGEEGGEAGAESTDGNGGDREASAP
jgi:secreted trypsin-like serine protease